LLPEEYVGAGMSWLVVVHVILAGCLMFAYARYRGLGEAGAFVAALGYMFAGKWLLHILAGGHYIMTPLAWLPLVLLLLEQAIERRSMLKATWAGAIYALIVLGAHPQMTLYAGLFVAIWTLGCMVGRAQAESTIISSWGRRDLLWWLGLGSWTVIVAATLSAVQLLPALEASGEATRAGGVSLGDTLAVCVPSVLGFIGPGWAGTWEDHSGLGVLWISAGLTIVLLNRGRVRFEGLICLGLIFFGMGGAALVQWLPGFRLFQIPVRMLMLLALPVAMFCGRTVEAMFGEGKSADQARERCRQILLRVFCIGLVLTLASGATHFVRGASAAQTDNGPNDAVAQDEMYSILLEWLRKPTSGPIFCAVTVFAGIAGLWLLGARCHLPLQSRRWLWTLLLVAELWAMGWPRVATPLQNKPVAMGSCVGFLVNQQQQNPVDHWRVLDRGLPGFPSSSPLGPALPMIGAVQIEPVLGYNSFDVRRYKEYLQFIMNRDEVITPRSEPFGFPIIGAFRIQEKDLFDLLGTRFVVEPETNPYWDPNRNWARVLRENMPKGYSFLEGGVREWPPFLVYQNPNYFPRAFIVHSAEPLADRPNVLQQMKKTDFRRRVLLEGAPAQGLAVVPGEELRLLQPATILNYYPNHVAVRTKTREAGFLVLTDVWFPGWRATVDGAPSTLYRANFVFRAVAVPAGEHDVVFQFEPISYAWGLRTSRIALVLLGCAALVALALSLKRRRNTATNARHDRRT